ncbi:MAG TPA: TetR/AcrR family transcriptional regulator, partial [Enhygromyxa sp.]|nr:TetR/AcrR family transcriptional regulator [Enhygromyxa sp.]
RAGGAGMQTPKKERRSVREESRAVYRQAIIDAAIRIFGRTGFNATKIADVAAEAGVATGTLYNYFSSKEDIFLSILDDGRERLGAELELCTKIDEPLQRMRELIRVMFEFLEEHGALFTIYMQIGANPIDFRRDANAGDEKFRQFILSQFTAALTEAGDRVRSDYPPQTLAMALGGLLSGAVARWVEHGCQPGLHAQTDTIMDLFLHGATPR